ncbi:hybrid sensor histidine kinase/response regulator [Anthocerotibacter panamensis]|uniref:hybrid sensor histidine kinase/response regulator n=1 Tax=Anthocerotibacter panamensis TaxID=2857077 RepID=UPI001C40838D|nr:hybrid sensor histidine kinase/response regulator [Anthocerotibacter panamensis]
MTLDYDIRQQACQFFIQEAPELLQVIEQELLALPQDRTLARVHNLMRAAHSLKGGAATVGFEAVKTVAHRLEDYFTCLYHKELILDRQLQDLLFQSYDHLSLLVMAEVNQQPIVEVEARSEKTFVLLEERLAAFRQKEMALLDAADLGIDIVQSIFEVDVAEGLERLREALRTGEQVAEVLREQTEVFQGLGELTSLAGFGAIAQTVLLALETRPDQPRAIAEAALANFQQAQQGVLAGDRTDGGTPSALLQSFTHPLPAPTAPAPVLLATATPASSPIVSPPPHTFFTALREFWQRLFSRPAPPASRSSNPRQVSWPEHSWREPDFRQERAESIWQEFQPPEVAQPVSKVAQPLFTLPEQPEEPPQSEIPEAPCPLLAPVVAPIVALEEPEEQSWTAPSALVPENLSSLSPEQKASAAEALMQVDFADIPALFDDLPPALDLFAAPMPAVAVPVVPPAAPRSVSPTVRVELERMDRLNNLVGELVINHNSLSVQNEQIQGTLQELQDTFEDFRRVGRQLQDLSDHLLVSPASRRQALDRYFDPLELDHYQTLHQQLQEALEYLGALEASTTTLAGLAQRAERGLEQRSRMLTHLRDDLMWARMLPLAEVFNRFPRLLRDLGSTYDKPVALTLKGADILVDKAALEKLYDPLVHLIRNAFDHGLEPTATRLSQGKPAVGRIELVAYHRGAQTILEVRDDGRGLDLERITERAIAQGLLTVAQASTTPPEQILDLIFEPEFSTATQVSELSGRGMGLDVVRSQLQALKGTVTMTSVAQQGTTFILRIPLTLSVAKLLVFRVGAATYALALNEVQEILIPKSDQITHSGGQRLLWWRDRLVPLCPLQAVMTYQRAMPGIPPAPAIATPQGWNKPLLVLQTNPQGSPATDCYLALEIDQLITEQELVIKPFSLLMTPPPYFYGCTILSDGTLTPVIDGVALLQQVLTTAHRPTPPQPTAAAGPILVVDDSLVQRQTLEVALQGLGYRVLQAKDGEDALERLREYPAIQLVLCDIEMPIMNGFEFLTQRRQQPDLAAIPVVMLTSRAGEKHRQLAQQLGSQGYLTKPFATAELKQTLTHLLTPEAVARELQPR